MNDPSQDSITLAALICFAAAISVSTLVWIAIGRKVLLGEPLVPYEGRRPVPWKTVDVLAIFGLYFLPMFIGLACALILPPADDESANVSDLAQPSAAGTAQSEEADTQHTIIDLLRQDGTVLTWMLCVVAAVVVAPVVEEFLFRLVLQGWLETVEHGRRGAGMRPLIRGAKPILVSSVLFAAVHFRQAEPAADPDHIRMALWFQIGWSLMIVGYAVAWLRCRGFDLTAADLGIDFRRVKSDIGLGLVAFLAVACPVYALQVVLQFLRKSFWPSMVPDPIPLFFLALVLGFLYYRTHRLLPAIVLHMAFNGAALLLWLLLSQSAGG